MHPLITKFLFVNFLVHFGVFFYLALKRKRVQFALLSLTFLLLVLSFGLSLWLPQAEYHEHKLFWYFRILALATTAAALLFIFRQKFKKSAKKNTHC
jgi:hypothetical protein